MPPPRRAGAGDTSAFFAATLVLWAVSVGFEIGARGRRELAAVAAGFAFFQAANTAARATVSCDPLFVNTAFPLLHSPPYFGLRSSPSLSFTPLSEPSHFARSFPIHALKVDRLEESVRQLTSSISLI